MKYQLVAVQQAVGDVDHAGAVGAVDTGRALGPRCAVEPVPPIPAVGAVDAGRPLRPSCAGGARCTLGQREVSGDAVCEGDDQLAGGTGDALDADASSTAGASSALKAWLTGVAGRPLCASVTLGPWSAGRPRCAGRASGTGCASGT